MKISVDHVVFQENTTPSTRIQQTTETRITTNGDEEQRHWEQSPSAFLANHPEILESVSHRDS